MLIIIYIDKMKYKTNNLQHILNYIESLLDEWDFSTTMGANAPLLGDRHRFVGSLVYLYPEPYKPNKRFWRKRLRKKRWHGSYGKYRGLEYQTWERVWVILLRISTYNIDGAGFHNTDVYYKLKKICKSKKQLSTSFMP